MLWRIQNGELNFENDYSPKIVVLLAGTNNYEHTADQVADGILKITREIRARLPKTHIIVLAIPPRGKEINNVREKIVRINDLVEKHLSVEDCFDQDIHYLCCSRGHEFVNPQDGTISHTDMYDYLHFTNEGYQKFVEPILDEINSILSSYDN